MCAVCGPGPEQQLPAREAPRRRPQGLRSACLPAGAARHLRQQGGRRHTLVQGERKNIFYIYVLLKIFYVLLKYIFIQMT